MRHIVSGIAVTLALACTKSDVTIAPPRVNQGGRAIAIAVSQSDGKRILVATASGGLFRTFDGGVSFQHLDAFPNYLPLDVAIASLDPNIMIATGQDDFRKISGGGIWRSTDGGASWKRPIGWPPATSGSSCSARPWARGISHMPLTRTFYVATDCGIAVSQDNGASFSMVVLNPAQPKVRGVFVINRTTGVAEDDSRLWFLNNGMWQMSTGGPDSLVEFSFQNFASPWWTGLPIIYHMGMDREVYFTTDGGANWVKMATPPHGGGREKHIGIGRGLDGDPTHFDIYFGDGFTIWREALTTAVPGGSNQWKQPQAMDHRDPADIAFTPGYEKPYMLATDGGVHLTPDNGKTWKLTGSNYGGFTALQIGEMTGRAVGGSKPHLDLYYATQDNDIKGSADGGQTWPGSISHEGAFIMADAANPAHVDGPVIGRRCSGCPLFQAPEHLGNSDPPLFKSAASSADPAAQIVGSTYIQHVRPSGTSPTSFDFFLTTNQGTSWSQSFSLPFAPFGNVKFAGPLTNPVAYVGVKRGSNVFGLFRVQDVLGQPTVRRADSTGFKSIGLLGTDQATYSVFGVDPSNPDHLIASDVTDSVMKASNNGGISWYPLPALTTAVTDSGRFLFQKARMSFATVVAWDPANTCHILVGTMQNGVIRSTDGGLTWSRVAGSPVATYVTSFFFPPTGAIWMSTYGRGLWTLSVDRTRAANSRCAFPPPPGRHPFPPLDSLILTDVISHKLRAFGGLRDSVICAACTILTVKNGWVTDLIVKGSTATQVAISSGTVVERNSAGKEVPLSVPNVYSEIESPGVQRLAGIETGSRRRVRAIVLRNRQVVGLVTSRDELPFAQARTPMIYLANADMSMVPSVVQAGGSLVVQGYGFVPGTGNAGVTIVAGQDTVARGVSVSSKGEFTITIPVSRGPAMLEISAVQRDGARLTIESASITAVAREDQ